MIKMNKLNIVLIGFMGCGKSTIGKKLAKEMNYYFIDSDREIENEIEMSISDFFTTYGESKFRSIEEKIISKIASSRDTVIATGGGIIKNSNNITTLRDRGILFYLKASPEHIYQNVKCDTTRPLLNTENKLETIKNLLNERSSLYESASDFTIDISNQSIDDIVFSILSYIRRTKE